MPQRTEPSTLLDEIFAEQATKENSACTIRSILESFTESDRAALLEAFNNPSIQGTVIADILKRRGLKVSSHTVQRHRRGGCSCG